MLIVCPKCSVQYEIPEGMHIPAGKKLKCSNCQHLFVLDDQNQQDRVDDLFESSQQIEVNPVPEEEPMEASVFAEDNVFQPEEVPQPFMPVAAEATEQRKRGVSFLWLLLSVIVLISFVLVGVVYRDVLFGHWRAAPSALMKRQDAPVRSYPQVLPQKTKPIAVSVQDVDKYIKETPQVVMLPQIQSVRFEKKQGEELEVSIEGVLKNPTTQSMKLPKKVRAFAYDAQGQVLFEKEIYLTDTSLPAGEILPFFGTYQPAPDNVQWIEVTF